MSQQIPATHTPVSAEDLYLALRSAWIDLWGETPSRQSLLVLVAQWALETGRGAHCIAWNLGNVRWTSGSHSDWCEFQTTENLPSGVIRELGKFRAFSSLEDGAMDYLDTLQTEFASAWEYVLSGNPIAFASAAKAHGYFTGDLSVYAKSMASIFSEFDRSLPIVEGHVDTTDQVAPT